MQGYAYTIFAGDQIEKFNLEVIGVLDNFLGPRQSIILVQLKGAKVEHTGVVAGMSGSPVYLDGKLAGALSLKLGIFTKEPIAGVTPINDVLNPPPQPATAQAARSNLVFPVKPPRARAFLPAPRSSPSRRRLFSPDSSRPRSSNSRINCRATALSQPRAAPPRRRPMTATSSPGTWQAWCLCKATSPSTPPVL